MSGRTWRAALPAIGVLMLCSVSRAQLFILATESVGPPPTDPGTGLNGYYFHVDDAFQGTIVTIANARQIAMGTPTATYTATTINYGISNDDVPVQVFLDTNGGTDGDTLMPLITDPVGSAVYDMKGYLSVPGASVIYHFGLRSDDGSLLTLGQSGITAIDNDGDHAVRLREADIEFEAPGLYPIEVLFYNDRYMGGIGGQILPVAVLLIPWLSGKLASLGGVSSSSVGAYGVGRVCRRGKFAWQNREAAEAP